MEQQTTSYTNLYQLICPYLMWFKSAFIPKGNMVRVKGCRKVKFFFCLFFFPTSYQLFCGILSTYKGLIHIKELQE